ncbi:MAG: DUF6438 domain-containing protein [Flavobacteriales bacterium]
MIKSTLLFPVLLLVPLLFGCKDKQAAVSPDATASTPPAVDQSGPRFGGAAESDSLFFSLERTPCFGACKAYVIKVYRSGFATYEGRSNVELVGKHTGQATEQQMEDLVTKAEGYGFFGMNDRYDGQVTDLPSTIITVVSSGRMKKVVARVDTPQAFKSFAQYAEGVLMPLHWEPGTAKQ